MCIYVFIQCKNIHFLFCFFYIYTLCTGLLLPKHNPIFVHFSRGMKQALHIRTIFIQFKHEANTTTTTTQKLLHVEWIRVKRRRRRRRQQDSNLQRASWGYILEIYFWARANIILCGKRKVIDFSAQTIYKLLRVFCVLNFSGEFGTVVFFWPLSFRVPVVRSCIDCT